MTEQTIGADEAARILGLKPISEGGSLTVDVPAAGAYLGLGRNQSYEAAKRGDIPVIPVGEKRLKVSIIRLAMMML